MRAPDAPIRADAFVSDRMGIVAAVANFLVGQHCNILDSAQFGDESNRRFFMRVGFTSEASESCEALGREFAPTGEQFGMQWQLYDTAVRPRILIMVSRFGHCLNDLLHRFQGAKPYRQAHGRGVKLIGATAHYVTEDLDKAPIIEQDVARVHHSMSLDEYVAAGRDVECVVLARAVTWHVERRILLNGHRTVIFR